MLLKSKEFQDALEIVTSAIGNLDGIAKLLGVTTVHTRTLLEKDEKIYQEIESVEIFSRVFYGLDSIQVVVRARNKKKEIKPEIDPETEFAEFIAKHKPKIILGNKSVEKSKIPVPPINPYLSMSIVDLRKELYKRDLRTTGTEPFLMARLQGDDKKKKSPVK